MELKSKRALVTGGAGFVGSHIIDLLVDEGCREIVAIDNLVRGRADNLASAMRRGPVRLVEGDIRDRDLMERLIRDADVVFHQAALRITHCAEAPRMALEVMVDATFALLELCVHHKIEKVVAASSASIYGLADQFPTSESQHHFGERERHSEADDDQTRQERPAAPGVEPATHALPSGRGVPLETLERYQHRASRG